MLDEIRTITIKELKEEIKENLEYAHPEKNESVAAANAFGVHYGFKPYVNDIFFATEDEAVAYTFNTETIYQNIKELNDSAKVIESYDDTEDTLCYAIFNDIDKIALKQVFFSPKSQNEITIKFLFEEEQLCVSDESSLMFTCKLMDSGETVWNEEESIELMFEKEGILYPENIRKLVEGLWLSWRNYERTLEELEKDLNALVAWINAMTKTKPNFIE